MQRVTLIAIELLAPHLPQRERLITFGQRGSVGADEIGWRVGRDDHQPALVVRK